MQIELVDITEIKPYANNPKNHNAENVEHIANSIKEFGFRQPIAIDEDGVIIAGHGRHLASLELGLEKVPCIRITDMSEEQKRAYRLADNKTNESGWIFDLLQIELDSLNLDMEKYGFENIAFDENSLNDLFTDAEEKEKEPKKIQCPHCGEWFEAL